MKITRLKKLLYTNNRCRMMYSRKASTYVLAVGLMALTSSCREKSPELKLLTEKVFPNYPSASAVEYYEGKVFVFGDDAPYLLILDTQFSILDTVHYLPDTAYRISKETKADVES